ncbi:MAG TPA: enoyl-CoA hydratase-related protein [Vicinamibacterales bacterium]|nr:enoyl-CoA hydratase-related protein [Vicinamibacterales bacterium]
MSAILIERGAVTTVTLNRPDVRNAFNEAMIEELTAFAAGVPADGSIRAVVLRGSGPVFSAGADVQWMSKMLGYSREENLADARQAASMFLALDRMPVPLIGRIHGAALGGGSGLAAVCDVVVAADDALFGFTEVVLGILPAMISPYVVRKIGLSAARELCLSGTRFSAARAKDIGLVHTVVPAADLDRAVDEHVARFRKAAPSAVAATKRLLTDVYGKRPAEVLALTVDQIATQRVSPEGQEGLRAFLEKRPAAWAASEPSASEPRERTRGLSESSPRTSRGSERVGGLGAKPTDQE